jgi:hypothetical protein
MAVIECSCGMIMSVSAAKPRSRCIRCGGVEFHVLERRKPTVELVDQTPVANLMAVGNGFPIKVIALATTVSEVIAAECRLQVV